MEYDLIALGETMLVLAPVTGHSLVDTPALLIDHAGAESNTCVGLARLALKVAWVSRLGADAAGDRIAAAIADEAVDVRWVERDPHRATGLMIKEPGPDRPRVRYYRSQSAASAMGPSLLDPVPIANARAVLVTGVTALLGAQPHAAGLALLERTHGLRIVDPNLRHGLAGSDRRAELVRPYVERCDLLLTGADELVEVIGAAATSSDEALARAASAIGPREVVVRGQTTVGALAGGAWHTLDIHRDTVADPIGAGDAFNAGYIAIRLRGGSVDDALRAAVYCGTAVAGAVGDTAAFPRTLP
jgi:2-dehydro-3-deoxygluconokinase